MSFKGFLSSLANEVKHEIEKKLDGSGGGGGGPPGSSSGSGSSGGMSLVKGLIGLVSGKGGGAGGGGGGTLNQIIAMIQAQSGGTGLLPAAVGKYLPAILKIAEVIGHGLGDDSPRTEQNPDGSFIDNFVKTIIGGRKIYNGGDDRPKVKPISRGGGDLPDYSGSSDSDAFQDYEQLRAQCLAEGILFEDPEFRATDSSVFFSSSERRRFEWLRPHEICGEPSFFVEGASRFDVNQGELGDCWLLAALANLTLNQAVFSQVVPDDNSFGDGYAGIFHFRFWQYGRWVDVVIDDRLPTVGGKLMFMHSEDCNELWSALLEKAYAKLHGSYEALKGGTTCEALEDFTGGVTEMYDLKSAPRNLLTMIVKAFERSSFLGCSIEPDPNVLEAQTSKGLIRGHAYSVTDIKVLEDEVTGGNGRVALIRIKNPWGNEAEWSGPWSDGSREWNAIDDETKEDIGLVFDSDGEFWMTFQDFLQHFDRLEICNLSPDSLEEDCGTVKWNMDIFEGAWIAGRSAGGCRNYINSFPDNPQYIIDLPDPDGNDPEGKCTIIVALMQKNRRARRKEGIDCLTIGFAIYRLTEDVPAPLPREFFKYNASVARSPTFINLREVCSRFRLPVGRYVIVPSTFEPNEEGEFIIRVFTEGQHEMMEGY